MCCATPSPPTSSITAPICAACRRCWAMRISRRPRSIPMSRASASRGWWRRAIRGLARPNAAPDASPETLSPEIFLAQRLEILRGSRQILIDAEHLQGMALLERDQARQQALRIRVGGVEIEGALDVLQPCHQP